MEEIKNPYKEKVLDILDYTISAQTEANEIMSEWAKCFGIELQNIGITANNKIGSLFQIFKKAGISIFGEYDAKNKSIHSNFVGDAIISDILFRQMYIGIENFKMFSHNLEEATDKIEERYEGGVIKSIFRVIKSAFVPKSDLESYVDQKIESANLFLSKYQEIDSKLFKYNLKDNIAQTLIWFIKTNEYNYSGILRLFEENITPTLQKLGLDDIIPQLKKELIKPQNGKSWELSEKEKNAIAGQPVGELKKPGIQPTNDDKQMMI